MFIYTQFKICTYVDIYEAIDDNKNDFGGQKSCKNEVIGSIPTKCFTLHKIYMIRNLQLNHSIYITNNKIEIEPYCNIE